MRATHLLILPLLALPRVAEAGDPPGYHPYLPGETGVRTLDLRTGATRGPTDAAQSPRAKFSDLDKIQQGLLPADADGPTEPGALPEGWVQRGNVVLPAGIADGSFVIEPETIFAVEDIPGNKYPRKHTLYLNFLRGQLLGGTGDNSAENKSNLASSTNAFPAFEQGQAKAVSVAQSVQADFAPYGIQVVYLERPDKILPYTMEMIGGDWTDINLDSPAGGVAPGADCGALGQRHVVYTFESGSAVGMANTASQEAGHAYGLDHTLNCQSVMSYCSSGDSSFQSGCSTLCEDRCQGPNSIGCGPMHDMFCGAGAEQQDDHAEMMFLFGGNEMDLEPPTAEIVSPEDGAVLAAGSTVKFRVVVDDNYGGFGWAFTIEKDGEILHDEPDYERRVDEAYQPGLDFQVDTGTYVLRVRAVDHYGGEAVDEVTIQVGEPQAGTGAEGSGTGDPSAGEGETGDGMTGDGMTGDDGLGASDGTGGDGSGDDVSFSDGPGPKGCACTAGGSPGSSWTLLGWLLLPLWRRRVSGIAASRAVGSA